MEVTRVTSIFLDLRTGRGREEEILPFFFCPAALLILERGANMPARKDTQERSRILIAELSYSLITLFKNLWLFNNLEDWVSDSDVQLCPHNYVMTVNTTKLLQAILFSFMDRK